MDPKRHVLIQVKVTVLNVGNEAGAEHPPNMQL